MSRGRTDWSGLVIFFDANIPRPRRLKELLQDRFPGTEVILFPRELAGVPDGEVLKEAYEQFRKFPDHKKIFLTKDIDFDIDSGFNHHKVEELAQLVLLIIWSPYNQKASKVGYKVFFSPLLAVLSTLCNNPVDIVGKIFIDHK